MQRCPARPEARAGRFRRPGKRLLLLPLLALLAQALALVHPLEARGNTRSAADAGGLSPHIIGVP
jgi:hypothetical protein